MEDGVCVGDGGFVLREWGFAMFINFKCIFFLDVVKVLRLVM